MRSVAFWFATAAIAVRLAAPALRGCLEVVLRPGYGSAGDKSPGAVRTAGVVQMAPAP